MNELSALVARYGIAAVKEKLRKIEATDQSNNELTIISNQALHNVPSEYIFGELFIASQGALLLESDEGVTSEIIEILRRLKTKLHEKTWTRVYIHYTGPQVLGSAIKFFVYRAIGIDTVDFMYVGGRYFKVDIDYRSIH